MTSLDRLQSPFRELGSEVLSSYVCQGILMIKMQIYLRIQNFILSGMKILVRI